MYASQSSAQLRQARPGAAIKYAVPAGSNDVARDV
jgi:hypothetical protein